MSHARSEYANFKALAPDVHEIVSALLRTGIALSHLGDCLDQHLEQVRRSLSLDPAGAAKQGSGRGVLIGKPAAWICHAEAQMIGSFAP